MQALPRERNEPTACRDQPGPPASEHARPAQHEARRKNQCKHANCSPGWYPDALRSALSRQAQWSSTEAQRPRRRAPHLKKSRLRRVGSARAVCQDTALTPLYILGAHI